MISSYKVFTGSVEFIVEPYNRFLTANVAELEGIVRAMYLTYEHKE
jgi:hypothetical protein